VHTLINKVRQISPSRETALLPSTHEFVGYFMSEDCDGIGIISEMSSPSSVWPVYNSGEVVDEPMALSQTDEPFPFWANYFVTRVLILIQVSHQTNGKRTIKVDDILQKTESAHP
jgi:hypothetical protein